MKNEFHDRRNRWSGFKGRSLITLVLVFSMIISIPFFSAAAGKFDECSLNVIAGSQEEFPDLADANLKIDLYKVADAQPIEGSDGYTFELLESYTELVIKKDMTAEEWRALSQQAAGIVLDASTGTAKQGIKPAAITGNTEAPIEELDAGLYLLIARSADAGYVTTKEDGTIVTRASSGSNNYIFLPELVSLPTKEPENGVVNTANSGEWIYDVDVYLKPEKGSGSLKIVKTLERYYVNGEPPTFVFEVEARLGDNEEPVYRRVVSIVFNDAGQKELLLENIPVGATVTVREVYSGACYTVVGNGTQTTVITADLANPATVQFINDYDGSQTGGQGITNHFEYDTVEKEWKWEKKQDGSQG